MIEIEGWVEEEEEDDYEKEEEEGAWGSGAQSWPMEAEEVPRSLLMVDFDLKNDVTATTTFTSPVSSTATATAAFIDRLKTRPSRPMMGAWVF